MISRMLAATIGVALLVTTGAARSDLYVSSLLSNAVGRYDEITGAGGILLPAGADERLGIAIGPDGHLYVSGFAGVTRHDRFTGSLLQTFESVAPPPPATFRILTSIAIAGGKLHVADLWNGQVLRFDLTTGAFLDVFIDAAALGLEPHGLAFTPDGSSLLISSDLVNRIRQYDAVSGASQGFFSPDDGLHSAQIAFGPDGNLYVPDLLRDNVRRYDGASGTSLGVFASGGGMTDPFGMAFGPDGNLYVSSGGDERIYVYDGGTGSFLRSFVASGLDLGSLTYLAFASPIPEPDAYLLWLAATGVLGLRLNRFARRKPG